MATRNSSDPDAAAVAAYRALPFVHDYATGARRGARQRDHWHIPKAAKFSDACAVGQTWAARFLEYVQTHDDGAALVAIVGGMAQRHAALPALSGAHGYAVGFLNVIADLAAEGASACGGADRHVARLRVHEALANAQQAASATARCRQARRQREGR